MITEELVKYVDEEKDASINSIREKFKCTRKDVMAALDEVNKRARESHKHDNRHNTIYTIDEGINKQKEAHRNYYWEHKDEIIEKRLKKRDLSRA